MSGYIYRVRIGVLSRKGIMLNPLDFVVSAESADVNSVRRYYDEKYRGFTVEVLAVEQVTVEQVTVCTQPVQAKTTPSEIVRFLQNDVSTVTIDTSLCVDYTTKKKAYENARDTLLKESIAKILAINTHLLKVVNFELLSVGNKNVCLKIEAELKGTFVSKGAVCIIDC